MRLHRGVVLAGAAGLLIGAAGTHAIERSADRAAIEAIVHDYILAHPDIIPQALERLQSRETAAAVRSEMGPITTPFAGAWAGNPHGDVTLVMFTDYACGYCRASAPMIERLLATDPKLRVVWREIPVLGPDSEAAARLALAAARAGRYPAFHRALFAGGQPDAVHRAAAARAAGLDSAQVAAADSDPAISREIDNNLALAARLRIEGTPAFVIGDTLLNGAGSYERLARQIALTRQRASNPAQP